MKERLIYPLRFYVELLLVFIVEKPLFMLYAGRGADTAYTFMDVLSTVWHGLPVDMSVAGYLVLLPLVLMILSIWMRNLPFRPILHVYNAIISLILALVFIADAAIYPFWGFKLDASVFFYMQSPADALASVSVWFLILGFALVLVLTVLLTLLLSGGMPEMMRVHRSSRSFRRTMRGQRGVREPRQFLNRGWGTAWLVLLAALAFLAIRGGFKESTMNIGRAYYSTDQFLNHSAVNPAFSLLSSMGKEEDFSQKCNFYPDDSRLKERFEKLFPEKVAFAPADIVLNTTRPDILLVILEGFGADFVGELGGIEGVAPNLERISKEGIFFKECYAGSYRTDRGTVCLLNGHPGLPQESIMKMPAKSRALPSVPAMLAQQGYSNTFLYGGDINFTNMQSYLWSGGYQNIMADTDFSKAERNTGAWGVQDGISFDRLYGMLTDGSLKSPWHTAFLTLSSHEPFEVPYSRLDDKVSNSFAYTDSCLGHFVDRLKETPVWDNLLMLIVPDHGFCHDNGNRHLPHAHHIPMIWTGGAVKDAMTVGRPVNQYDLAATLLSQLGLDHSEFRFSRDIFAKSPSEPFAFYTFNNGFGYIDGSGMTVYDIDADAPIYGTGQGEAERLEKGKLILQVLYDDLQTR